MEWRRGRDFAGGISPLPEIVLITRFLFRSLVRNWAEEFNDTRREREES